MKNSYGCRSVSHPARGHSWLPSVSALIVLVLAGGSVAPAARAGTIFTDDFEGGVKFTNPNPVTSTAGTIVSVGTSISPTHVLQLTNYPGTTGALYTLPNTYALGTYSLSFWNMRASGFLGSSFAFFGYDAPSNPPKLVNNSDSYYNSLVSLTWEKVTTSTTISAGNAAIGKAVQFSLYQSNGAVGSVTSKIYLDNVSVDFTPASAVPEIDPAGMGSVIALVSGALGLLERRRRAFVAA